MARQGKRDRQKDGHGSDDFVLEIGRECVAWILGHPSDFDEGAKWLLSLPEAGADQGTPQHFGPILHRLTAAKNQVVHRYQNEPEHVVDRLTVVDAHRIILYAALVLVPHFDASFVGLGWPWRCKSGSVADGRELMKAGTDGEALAKLAKRCLMIAVDRGGPFANRRDMSNGDGVPDPTITVFSSSQIPGPGSSDPAAGIQLRREIRAWVAAGGEARRLWLLRLWERSLVVPRDFPGTHDRQLWSQLEATDRLAMHAGVVIGIHDAESTEPIIPNASYSEWRKPEGAEPDWAARGRAALGVSSQPLLGRRFDPAAFDADAARESFVAVKAAHATAAAELNNPDLIADSSDTEASPRNGKGATVDPWAAALAGQEARKKAAEAALANDPRFRAAVEQWERWVRAQRAAADASAPFREELHRLIAAHPTGYAPDSETARDFDALKQSIADSEATAFAAHGFPLRKRPGSIPELTALLRSLTPDRWFDLQELMSLPRPTDTLWRDAEDLLGRDPFLAPLPAKPDDGRQRYAALVKWSESQVEAAALKALGEREVWGVDELPPAVDIDLLRCLDAEGFIVARGSHMQNRQKYRGDSTPPTPAHGQWCSPLQKPEIAGDWEVILAKRTRDAWNHPFEVKVSEHGRAQLARMRRGVAALADLEPEAAPFSARARPRAVAVLDSTELGLGKVRKPGGWTRKELVDEAKEKVPFSATVFDKIRRAAAVKPGERGGSGAQRRFSKSELRELIKAVEDGPFRYKLGIVSAWHELLAD